MDCAFVDFVVEVLRKSTDVVMICLLVTNFDHEDVSLTSYRTLQTACVDIVAKAYISIKNG